MVHILMSQVKKKLSYVFHNQPMGRDTGESLSPKNPEWIYPSPNSVNEIIIKAVCDYVK